MILAILLFIHSIVADFQVGYVMPDGKVDKVVEAPGKWYGPLMGADLRMSMAPSWQALQDWNQATVGVGLGYWHMGHDKLGLAFTPYVYMDVPLVRSRYFELGLRPGVGVAFMTKTYRNTVPDGQMFKSLTDANQCIGSVTNLYFPEALYMNFPIINGWGVSLSGGWYHISNGSTRQPNSGYNIFGAELGVRKVISATSTATDTYGRLDKPDKKWSVALGGTMSARQVYYRDQQSFLVGSMHASASWHAHKIFHLGGGVDVFYDGAYVKRDTYFGKTNLAAAEKGDCWRMGVSLQPEFVVGGFSLGLHLGAYLYDPVKELEPKTEAEKSPTGRLDKSIFYSYNLLKAGSAGNPDGWMYTSVVLRYQLPWHIFIQAMMKSHLTKVEFISLGLGFYY